MRTPVLAIGLSLAALGCTRETPIAIRLAVPADFPTGRAFELLLFDGASCPDVGDVALDALATAPRARTRGVEGMLGALGALDAGPYALAALVRDDDCTPRLYGCVPFVLGDVTEIRVPLADPSWTEARVCASDRACAAGVCAEGDGGAPPDGGTSCVDLAPLPLPASCVRESECGPFGVATCRGVSCALCVPEVVPLTDVMIGGGARSDVVGNRFALAIDDTHVHVLAAVRTDTGAERVRRVSGDLFDPSGGPFREDVPAGWGLVSPYAVGLGAGSPDGDVRVTVYDETADQQICTSGGLRGAEPLGAACSRISDARDPVAEPAFSGDGAALRQIWLTDPPGGPDLASVSWTGACETAFMQRNLSLPFGAEGLIVVGTTGRWAAMGPSSGGDLVLVDAQPEGNARPLPCVEAAGDPPEPVTLADRTGRFAFAHLEADRYVLAYPAGGELAIRSAICEESACTVSDEPLRTVALGTDADLLSAVPLTAPDGRTEGFALALARRSCAGLSEVEIVIFDERFEPVVVYPMQTDEVADVRLGVWEGAGPGGERRRALVLGTLVVGGSFEAALYLGGLILDASCDG